MATELAKAYVQIEPTAKGIKGAIEKELNGEAISAGKASGASLGANLVTALKGAIIAAGIGTIIKESLTAGGDLQQSFGGLDTIYGEAAEAAKAYAYEAAQAGISANDYAEQAVGFGAALKQAFGGDTAKAVEAANTAIMDMTDNAAKMGTPLESIQSAYAGFAKQNYTMLDNLKLGYGGTKTEMERLLADAQALTGVEYNIDNLGDVYEAIHVIQGELGLTGVAAQEASTTFSGSFGAMQAAATNFLASLSTGEGVSQAMTTLIGTVETFLVNNLLPMIGNILASVPDVVTAALPLIVDAVQRLIDYAPQMLDTGMQMAMQVAQGIINTLPQFIEAGRQFILNMLNGLMQALPNLISNVGSMLNQLISLILSNLPQWMEQGANFILNMIQGITKNIPAIVQSIGQVIAQLIQTIVSHLPEILAKGVEIVAKLVAGLIQAIPQIVGAVPQLIRAITDGFKSFDWGGIGKAIIEGIANGLKNAGGLIRDAAVNAARSAWEGAKSFLGINSPSTLFRDTVGAMMAEGMAIGFEENVPTAEIEDSLRPMASVVPDVFGGSQYSYGGFTINVYGAPGQSVQDLADIVSDRINSSIRNRQAVFA